MPLDFNLPNLLTGGGNSFNTHLNSFEKFSGQQITELAQRAPDACGGGGGISDPYAMETCVDTVCGAQDKKMKALTDSTGFSRFAFFAALRGTSFLATQDPITLRAMRYHLATQMADVFCKDPPNDGNRAPVTEELHAPAASRPSFGIALVGLAALAAVRLGSIVYPELRPASPGLIEGIYLWMGITSPAEIFSPPVIDGDDGHYRYTGA